MIDAGEGAGFGAGEPKARASARAALRAATAGDHDRVDKVFSRADLQSRKGLADFLFAQASAYLPVERALEQAGVEDIVPGWASSRRAPRLTADLAAFGLAPPAAAPTMAFQSVAEILGGAYVLEGSRLGGALLRRSIPPEFVVSFLEPVDSASWRGFLALLEDRLGERTDIETAIASARAVFALFEQCGQRLLPAS